MMDIKNVTSVIRNEISKEEFLQKNAIQSEQVPEIFSSALTNAYNNHDWQLVEYSLIFSFVYGIYPKQSGNILCKLILEDWHYQHENIALNLKEQKNPATVNCLFEAAQKKFEYLDYDDTFQLANKCISALGAIRDNIAIEKLNLLMKSKNKIIAEYATNEIERKWGL